MHDERGRSDLAEVLDGVEVRDTAQLVPDVERSRRLALKATDPDLA